MTQPHIIRRTAKLRQLIALIRQRRVVYLSAFFYSGKTVLLDQLAGLWDGAVLPFDPARDDWAAFRDRVARGEQALLVIDSIDAPPDAVSEELATLLNSLSDGQYAVLAGRAQLPETIHRLCVSGVVAMLGREYMMFDEEEILQLFLEYGIELTPPDVRLILDRLWGWAFSLHILAQQILRRGGDSLHALIERTRSEIQKLLVSDVVSAFPEQERRLMYNLSPFESFTEDMARMVTGRNDAPRLMERIARSSYMLLRSGEREYTFVPIVRQALFAEMRNLYTQDYINGQYKRAALYYELQNRIPMAITYYRKLGDVEKIRELLIRDTFNRPADGDYVDLREGYALLTEETILAYPELMKGKAEIESLLGHAEESERWYGELDRFIRTTSARDARCQTAEAAKAYLDLCLSQRGSRHTLGRLIAVAKNPALRQSEFWRNGFNVSGNSVSLLNGGLDFCRWVPHGPSIYRLFKGPIELALGRGGIGVADVAIAERELEASLDGDYTPALTKAREGLMRVSDNTEIRCAAIGIQSRIEAARGDVENAIRMIDNAVGSLPQGHPRRLDQNLEAFRLQLGLLRGDLSGARAWLESRAPDETRDFIIMDRYALMLKLRLYIITAQWSKVPFLVALLRQYFASYDRPYMLIQLDLMEAVFDARTGKADWRARMEEALALAKRYRLVRVVADEGIAIIDMLNAMALPNGPWEQGVLTLTRRQAANYPNYMKQVASKPVFTDREYQVYSLMIAGYRNAKIASILNITERTVKYFCRLIYQKLGVTTRAEALNRAAELGDIK